jgi:hypothetical protein
MEGNRGVDMSGIGEEFLVEKGAYLEARNNAGLTALLQMIKSGAKGHGMNNCVLGYLIGRANN